MCSSLADDTQTFINISGTATGKGTITVTLKDAGGKDIGSYTYTAREGDRRSDVASGLKNSGNIVGYSDQVIGKLKDDDGIISKVFKIKVSRGGAKLNVNVSEDIPGINVEMKPVLNNGTVMFVNPDVVQPGMLATIDLFGVGNLWTKQEITALDFGDGIISKDFKVLSDDLITAVVLVDPASPLGPEHVDVIGVFVDDDGEVEPDVVLSTSETPLFVGVLVGDVNCDGIVNLLDVGPFVEVLTNGKFNAKADINGDGQVNLLDVGPFVELLGGG